MLKSNVKQLMRMLGLEIKRYTPATSDTARLISLLNHHKIDLVLDIGANEGKYIQFLRELGYQGKAISFEPLFTAYQQLEKNSKKDNKWEIAPRAALGNFEGEITLNVASNSQSSSLLPMLDSHLKAAPNSVYINSETVKIYQLDTIPLVTHIQDYKAIFAKIDVQGFEKQVIEGARQLLPNIIGMQIELSLINLYNNQILYQEMIQWLQQLGYELYSLSSTFTDPKTSRVLQIDGIFFKS